MRNQKLVRRSGGAIGQPRFRSPVSEGKGRKEEIDFGTVLEEDIFFRE